MSTEVLDDPTLVGEGEDDPVTRLLRQVAIGASIVLIALQICVVVDMLGHGDPWYPVRHKITVWKRAQAEKDALATVTGDELAAEVEPWLTRMERRKGQG